MTYDSRPETLEHIGEVQALLGQVASDLGHRADVHDASKLVEPEKSVFDRFTPKLRETTYGSDEYRGALEGMGEGLRHHYAHNSHHPEHGEPDLNWAPIEGFEGSYSVSNYGDVRSHARSVERSGPRGRTSTGEKMLRPNVTPKGYLRVQLRRNGRPSNRMVHRLVSEAFVPNPEGKPEVNHRDGDKRNNYFGNLEWTTASENQQHAYDTGLKQPAVKHVVHCPELDLTTFGTQAMERALRERGYEKADASGIWGAMDREGKHLGLTFEGTLLAEYRRSRFAAMDLMDLTECLCDWMAATQRHDDGDIFRSIELNQERFGYGDEVKRLLLNTATALQP